MQNIADWFVIFNLFLLMLLTLSFTIKSESR